ncbi:MAG TPA: TolC family outer membrane protein [Stellaceae bacterium]|nr:TolC family outer membrane protein [Stellaceae bacterium]
MRGAGLDGLGMPGALRSGGASWARLTAALLAGCLAAPAGAETLQDALSLAYSSNPSLLAERAQLEATNETLPQALSNWRPTAQVTVTGGKDRVRNSQYCAPGGKETTQGFSGPTTGPVFPCGQSFGATSFPTQVTIEKLYQSTYDVTVTQPLYRGGRTTAQTAEAYNQISSERGHLTSVEVQVLLTVVTDYLSVIQNVETVALNKENEDILRKQAAATETRYHGGELTHTDLYQAEAAYAEAIAQRKAAEGQLEVARAAYRHDVGAAPGDLVKPTSLPELPATLGEAEGIAAASAPSVIQAQYAQQAAEDNVDVVRGQLLPTVVAQADFQKTSDVSAYGEQVTSKSVIAQGQWTVYEGGSVYSQSRQAQKAVEQRKHELDDARRAAVQNAQQSWAAFLAARSAIKDLEHAVAANQGAMKGLEEEVRVGTRTVQDVLLQQQSLFQAQLGLVGAQHDELLDEFTLVAAIGRLTAKNLALPVEYYDPDKHLDAVRDKWFGFQTEP